MFSVLQHHLSMLEYQRGVAANTPRMGDIKKTTSIGDTRFAPEFTTPSLLAYDAYSNGYHPSIPTEFSELIIEL